MKTIENGRKGCGGCYSESNELMQFNGILPGNSNTNNVLHEVSGTRDDIQAVFSLADLSLDKVASKKRQMEAVLS
jgi:hypothetical protein